MPKVRTATQHGEYRVEVTARGIASGQQSAFWLVVSGRRLLAAQVPGVVHDGLGAILLADPARGIELGRGSVDAIHAAARAFGGG
jgi:hypothetical protein